MSLRSACPKDLARSEIRHGLGRSVLAPKAFTRYEAPAHPSARCMATTRSAPLFANADAPYRAILRLATPTVFAMLSQSVVNEIDLIFFSRPAVPRVVERAGRAASRAHRRLALRRLAQRHQRRYAGAHGAPLCGERAPGGGGRPDERQLLLPPGGGGILGRRLPRLADALRSHHQGARRPRASRSPTRAGACSGSSRWR